MVSGKTSYAVQTVVIVSVFFFVLFNLVFKLVIDLRTESREKETKAIARERARQIFVAHIDDRYKELITAYEAEEYEKAIDLIKQFNEFGNPDYKNLPDIKKEIRLVYLKKKLDFIPKIQLDEFVKLSEDIVIEEDQITEVFIRTPRWGQYFYTTDLPVTLEGVALSVQGDFSDSIVWTSNLDGELGRGRKIDVRLSVGEHEITATGTNGKTTGAMNTRIIIEASPDFLK